MHDKREYIHGPHVNKIMITMIRRNGTDDAQYRVSSDSEMFTCTIRCHFASKFCPRTALEHNRVVIMKKNTHKYWPQNKQSIEDVTNVEKETR